MKPASISIDKWAELKDQAWSIIGEVIGDPRFAIKLADGADPDSQLAIYEAHQELVDMISEFVQNS